MRIKILDLRRIIREALVDNMRLPDGPNSRDDADDENFNHSTNDDESVEKMSWNAKG